MAELKMVVRNARTQVMDVMESNIAGEPLEDSRQFVERTALQRRCRIVPVLGARLIGTLELMLHVK
jgi:hypothetical protein